MRSFIARALRAAATGVLLTVPAAPAVSDIGPYDSHGQRFEHDLQAYVDGVVSEILYEHPALFFRVISIPDGSAWKMVVAPLSHSEAQRYRSAGLAKGADVSVVGWPSKDGTNDLAVARMTINGKPIRPR